MAGRNAEAEGSRGANTLDTMIENIVLADEHVAPLCQDTGTVIFWVRHPFGVSQRRLKAQIRAAVADATAQELAAAQLCGRPQWQEPRQQPGSLRRDPPRDPLRGVGEARDRSGPSCSRAAAARTWAPSTACRTPPSAPAGTSRGCASASSTPSSRPRVRAARPGILGVCVGGDRVVSYERSKEVLLRKVGTANPDPTLDALEKQLTDELNSLGIGPMGYGGRTTVLDVFIEELWRHPASFFVSISYMCWSSRRMALRIDPNGFASFE